MCNEQTDGQGHKRQAKIDSTNDVEGARGKTDDLSSKSFVLFRHSRQQEFAKFRQHGAFPRVLTLRRSCNQIK